jgi:ribA/ribD-fused uncharacterized protein
MDEKILFYDREFYMFSNFSSFMVEYKGVLWMTSEHAYQASKFVDAPLIEQIKNARSSHDAFKLARANPDRVKPDWDNIKLQIMDEIVRAKHSQHAYIQKKLLETGTKEIVEDSPVDSFWGWGSDRKGENNLGKIWMRLREELTRS